jgi:hypothetical protein
MMSIGEFGWVVWKALANFPDGCARADVASAISPIAETPGPRRRR